MRTGKLPPALLARLLRDLSAADPRVRLGPRPGEDAAVVEIAGGALVVTTDPITFVSADAAWYAVQVNANDIAASGAEPQWFAATVLLPPTATETAVVALFQQLREACKAVGVSLITGHTEITAAVTQPLIVGTMLGTAPAGETIGSGGARPGDALVLAGAIGIEGAATLAREAAKSLRLAGFSAEQLAEAAGLLHDPGISVLRASRSLRRTSRPHALHDATEGGVATALREVAEASGVGVVLQFELLPLLPITRAICRALDLNPLGLISSGCLIAAVAPDEAARVLGALSAEGIAAAIAGRFTAERALLLASDEGTTPLPEFDRDELARFFDRQGGG